MRLDKPKTTIIIVTVLTVLCAGSFFAVRMINKNTQIEQPVTISSMDTQNLPSETQPTETAAPLDTTQLAAPTEDTLNTDLFTTFDMEDLTTETEQTEIPTIDYNTVTTTEPLLTTQTPTTAPATTADSDDDPENVIQRAAVFSNGFLGYQYDRAGQFYYTVNDPWQRNFGFNTLYDIGAPFLNFYYDTFRVKFTYKKMDWLIQFWKGQYGLVFVGSEIGCYYKPADDTGVHYDAVSDEDALYMSMTFYRNGEERLTREYAKYWWCTGFVPGSLSSFRDRSELSMRARLTMKDKTMLGLFCTSLEKSGFVRDENYSVSGLDVYISWN